MQYNHLLFNHLHSQQCLKQITPLRLLHEMPVTPNRLFLPKNIPTNINLAHTPDLLLILHFIARQAQGARDTALRLSPLPRLAAQPQRHALEVVAHAPLRVGRQVGGAVARDELVEHLALLIHHVEKPHEGRLRRELDRDDHISHRGKYGRRE